MPFQIKNFVSIVAAEVNVARSVTDKITDFQPGSVARTLMEAPAAEMEELYLQMLQGLLEAIPEATYRSFGFDRLQPARAFGFVSLSMSPAPVEEITIPLGTSFSTSDGRTYTSTEALIWAVGVPVIRVPVQSSIIGAAGNVAAGAINTTNLSGGAFVVSNSAITSGRDLETDDERRARFAAFVRSLSRGTMEACRFAVSMATSLDADGNVSQYVTRIGEVENPGYVRFWLYSSTGVPSSALVATAQRLLDGYRTDAGVIVPGFRPAGVRVEALPMVERAIPLSIRVSMFSGYELTTTVQQSISDIFSTTIRAIPAGTTLFLKTLVENLLAVDGVRSIVPDSNENIACAPSEALVPGLLTIQPL